MPKRHRSFTSSRSVVARVEEVVLAGSGADAFELVFALLAARLVKRKLDVASGRAARRGLLELLGEVVKRWPSLEVNRDLDVTDDVLLRVLGLLEGAVDAAATDAVFEQLVTRVGKGEKGQFFTPRYVVELATKLLALKDGERVVDPACGSGAFLAHARAHAKVKTWGSDLDPRAVRVGKLLAIASGDDPNAIVRADGLAKSNGAPSRVDVVATNPPFAGEVQIAGYELTNLVPRAERDALFLERAITMLRPGGRVAIVLPHNKVSAQAWAPLRAWLLERARVFAVVSLPRETFLPHTSQRTVLLFAKKRMERARRLDREEQVFFAVSERAGKDVAGEPTPHDLDAVARPLSRFLAAEGFTS